MSTSYLTTEKSSFIDVTWKIHDFLNKPSFVSSKSFFFEKANWQLEVNSSGPFLYKVEDPMPPPNSYWIYRPKNGEINENIEETFTVELKRLNSSIPFHQLFIKCFFKTSRGKGYNIQSSEDYLDDHSSYCTISTSLRKSKILTHKDLLLPNGTLTVCCQIRTTNFFPDKLPKSCFPPQQIGVVASPNKQNDASSQNETLDFNTQEVLPTTSANIFSDCNGMSEDDLSTETFPGMEVTWKIEDFLSKLAAVDTSLGSRRFYFAEAVWQLELRQMDYFNDYFEDFFDVYLTRLNSSVPCHPLSIKSFCKTSDGEAYKNSRSKFIFYNHDPSCDVFEDYLNRSELVSHKDFLLPKGTLTVCCETRMMSLSQNKSMESRSPQQQIRRIASPKTQHDAPSQTEPVDLSPRSEVQPVIPSGFHALQSDYKKLLKSEEDTDVCLKVSDKEFRVHKCIFRARSSVFSAMFKHDTEERASGEVVIKDLDPKSFPDFLQHMYDGSVDIVSEQNVFDLYTAADKYDMRDLKSECKNYIERTLSVDTFCEVVILALGYHERELLKLAIDFFCKNLPQIILTVKWQRFLKDYGTAANELLIKALVPTREE